MENKVNRPRCGENVFFTFDKETLTLTLYGSGDMYDYNSGDNPSPFDKAVKVKHIIIRENITSVGAYMFKDCTAVESVYIAGDVEKIGEGAFFNCEIMKALFLSKGLKNIDDKAFEYCENIFYIDLPDTLERIGDSAFSCCYELTCIRIPKSINRIEQNAFRDTILSRVYYDGGEDDLCSLDVESWGNDTLFDMDIYTRDGAVYYTG